MGKPSLVDDIGKGDYVMLTVKDTGIGISADDIERIFEPFYTTKPAGKGVGIGLSTCYSIVKNHNGEISVNSEEDKGSSFCVRIPGISE